MREYGDNYTKLFTLLIYFIHSRIRSNPMGAVTAHRLALELDAIRVVDKAIQDRIGGCRIPNLKMPAVLRDLRCHDRRAAIVAVVDPLHQITALVGAQLDHRPIVEDQQPGASQGLQQPRLAAMQPGNRQLVEPPREPFVEHRDAVAGGLIAQSTGNPAFADPARTRSILPNITMPMGGSIIGITLATVRAWRS
jgi:hypothetical protein